MKASEMKFVSSQEEYADILNAYKQNHPKNRTSNYLLPNAANAAIAERKLYMLVDKDMLLVFVKDRKLCHVYVMYTDAEPEKIEWDLDVPCILDEPVRSADRTITDEIRRKWDALGFAYRTTHIRVVWKPDHPEEIHSDYPVTKEYEITEEMVENWYRYLDTTALTVPDRPRPCTKDEIMFIIRDENGKIACQVYTYPSKNVINIYFLVTTPENRGKRLAREILRSIFESYHRDYHADRTQTWVDVSNTAVQSFKLGEKYENFLSHQYMAVKKEL